MKNNDIIKCDDCFGVCGPFWEPGDDESDEVLMPDDDSTPRPLGYVDADGFAYCKACTG